jgi:hypothetical protein
VRGAQEIRTGCEVVLSAHLGNGDEVRNGGGYFPLQRKISTEDPQGDPVHGWIIQTDASPFGGGAVLRHGKVMVEYFALTWQAEDFPKSINVQLGTSSSQSFLELLTVALALAHWGSDFVKEPCTVLGDNTGSLENLLQQKGKGLQQIIARELAWRRARHGWLFAAAHVPSEANKVPDALSRLALGAAFPEKELAGAWEAQLKPVRKFWRCV